jgi:hypothetical protein
MSRSARKSSASKQRRTALSPLDESPASDGASLAWLFPASHLQMHDEVQGVTEAATTMLTTLSGERTQLHNTQWKTQQKNSLGSVKKESDLSVLIEADSSTPAFEQQDSRICLFLQLFLQQHIDNNDIADCLELDWVPTITCRSHECFMALLNRIRFLCHHNNNAWNGGPAKAMLLKQHAKGLADARAFSIDHQRRVLKVHVCLQKAANKEFFHSFMSKALWSCVASLEAPHDAPCLLHSGPFVPLCHPFCLASNKDAKGSMCDAHVTCLLHETKLPCQEQTKSVPKGWHEHPGFPEGARWDHPPWTSAQLRNFGALFLLEVGRVWAVSAPPCRPCSCGFHLIWHLVEAGMASA